MSGSKMRIKWNSKISGIYAWVNELNGKMYVGQATNFYRRIYDEMNGFKNNKDQNLKKLYNAVKKYGISNFRVIKLLESPVVYLNKLECLLIGYYDTKEKGYNCTLGGEGSVNHIVTSEQIEKHKQTMNKYWNEDRRTIHSNKMKIWFNSKTIRDQERMISGNGWWLNPEIKEKHLSNTRSSMTSRRVEQQKLSLKKFYKTNKNKNCMNREIISPTNDVVKINGLCSFCKMYKIGMKGIVRVIRGEHKHYKGWHIDPGFVYMPNVEYVRDNSGRIHSFTSISQFCKNNGIDRGNLRKVLNGIGNSCGGFQKL